jgi:hypothetical protein
MILSRAVCNNKVTIMLNPVTMHNIEVLQVNMLHLAWHKLSLNLDVFMWQT